MAQTWRSSLWSKGSALGFISLIILGNIWFVQSFAQREAASWLQAAFSANVVWLLISGCGLGVHILLNIYRSRQIDESEQSQDSGDSL